MGSDPPPFPYGIDEQRLVVAPSVVPAEAVEVVACPYRGGGGGERGRGSGAVVVRETRWRETRHEGGQEDATLL